MHGSRLLRSTAMTLAALLADHHVTSGQATAIDVTYPSGDVTLAAELRLPAAAAPAAAAVIVQGSGASDRSNQWSREIADALRRLGLAVLLTDKRGAGASGGDWRTASFADLAADAIAGVEFLRTRPEIDPDRVGVVGISQGGNVVPLAAARSDAVAFVVNVSGKAVTFAEGSFVEMANTARQAGLDEDGVREVLRVNQAAATFLTRGDWDQYARARERGLQTAARGVVEGFPASRDASVWTFLRSAVSYDPLAYWVQVEQPVLVVYGEADEQDNVPVRESVHRLEYAFGVAGKTNVRMLVVPDAGHGIRDPRTHRLAPLFLETLGEWLREEVSRGGV